ncbi:aminoacyl-tRNA deacylase and HDOD domain-containing protein [Sulfuriflexus sp.]|uniref:aminoacyl-tRNA deacylase and HDOD domain-containing protein n=1 Tax=Sulfuriflexus sp. TaxID=2015443 RepID=UPI0028CF5761|nr:HDOD domain-containing protein [Sulfuriflexus sp.]MDT8404694.1 HDOD domain-containing protein [Sulfuriflexus sp.]
MQIVQNIGRYLLTEKFDGEILSHPPADSLLQAAVNAAIDPASVARSLLLSDDDGLLLVTFPASHCINLQTVNEQLQRHLQPVNPGSHETLFLDAGIEQLPPFSPFAPLECIVDSALAEQEIIYFPVGTNDKLIKMDADTFFGLQENAMHGLSFSHPLAAGHANQDDAPAGLPVYLQQRLTTMNSLPAIPATTRELLKHRNRPHSRVQDLARVIEVDPLLATQLMHIAGSALYAYRGTLKTLDDAITRVLGFESALNIALGLSTAEIFRGPKEGVAGQQRLFRDAVFCASLCEALGKQLPVSRQPEPGTAQLAGLLHNIGYALLGHLFSTEYKELNRELELQPEISNWHGFEQRFATTPAIVGSWLMRFWAMPDYLDGALLEQRNVHHHDDLHAQLILLANRLLHRYHMGDADSDELPGALLENLGISAERACQTAEEIIGHGDELDGLARQMAG